MKRQRCGSGAGQTSSQSSLVTETEAAAAAAAATGTSSTGSLRPAHHTVTRPCTRRGGATASLQGSDSSAGESFVEDLTSIAGPKFGAWLANQGITMSALAAWNEDMMTNALAAMAAEGNAVPLLVIREAVEAARASVGPQCTGDGRDEHEMDALMMTEPAAGTVSSPESASASTVPADAAVTSASASASTSTEAFGSTSAAATAAATGTSSTGSLRPAHHTVTRPCTRRGGVTASLQGSDSSAGESFVEDLTSIAGPKFGAWLANQGITMSALAAWNEDMMTNALAAMAAEGNAVPLLVIREAVEAARALVGPQCTGDGRDEHEQEDFANEDNGNFSATDEEEGSIELPSDDEELVYDHDINACGPGVEHQVNFTNEEHFVELEPNVEISENDLQQLKQEGNDFEYILQSQLAVGATTYRASSHHGQIQPRLRISFINAAIGFGLFLIDDIAVQPGTEIARYVGELLTQPKLDPRETQREQSSSNTKRRFVWDLAGDEACPVCKLTCDETVQNGQPILLCDVCDRSFHLACQGIADHTRWDRWACVDCVAYFVDRHTGRASSRSSSSATARSQNNENIIRRFNIKAIDATHKGNATRFINHSCNPNAIAEFDNTSREIKIIAAKVIASGRQITVDYSPDSNPDSLPPTAGTGVSNCLCRQPNCRGWVPV